jgi:hypothetical protein
MEGLGVDENIAQGSGGSNLEATSVPAPKKTYLREKRRRPRRSARLNFLTPRACESPVFPTDEGVSSDPASPEAGDDDSVFSYGEDSSDDDSDSEDMDEDEDEDAAAGESAFDKVSEVFVSEGEADVILSHKRLLVTIYLYVSKDAQGSSL